jgi:hypothetical protein
MISYKEILDQTTTPELSKEESETLRLLEVKTDDSIRTQFSNNSVVYIRIQEFNQLLNAHPRKRQDSIQKKWKELYEKEGWKISYNGEDNEWELSGK